LVVGATNPNTLVFFAAALPQFVDPSLGYVIVQMLVLLTVYSLMSLVGDTSWGLPAYDSGPGPPIRDSGSSE
jgi:threonine/homoserine/homoserine lactone efflux protein